MFISCKFESCRLSTLMKKNFATDMFLRLLQQAQNNILQNCYFCKTSFSLSHWEVFYKTPRSLATKKCSSKYSFLSLNQPLGGSLQDTCSHREVLYKIHWEVFYKIPSTMWCSAKYHWKLFYNISVINSHWVVFHKTKYKFALGGALN